jgi:hypothetical protein
MDLFNKSFNTTLLEWGTMMIIITDQGIFSPHPVGHTLYITVERKFQNIKILKEFHYNNQKN